MSLRSILINVANDTGVPVELLLAHSNSKSVAMARHRFCWEARQVKWANGRPRYSLPQIGAFLNHRDHTTIRSSCIRWQAHLDNPGHIPEFNPNPPYIRARETLVLDHLRRIVGADGSAVATHWDIASALRVSMTVVSEALKALEARGLIRREFVNHLSGRRIILVERLELAT